ncbi:hypothetical protein HDU98_002539 [Podochytrium sp. JEL0797]|nr:hypothetical protein HDU98_002539 [Podochytrium sp. JEL0797]
MTSPLDKQRRIAKYEVFLSSKLQPDLKNILSERDAIYEDIADLKLKNHIDRINENCKDDSPFKTLVDVGCDFYMQAKVTNTQMINVLVGLDCHVEFTMDEALEFIAKKEKHLERKADALTEKALHLKAQIKLVLAAIQEVLES